MWPGHCERLLLSVTFLLYQNPCRWIFRPSYKLEVIAILKKRTGQIQMVQILRHMQCIKGLQKVIFDDFKNVDQ